MRLMPNIVIVTFISLVIFLNRDSLYTIMKHLFPNLLAGSMFQFIGISALAVSYFLACYLTLEQKSVQKWAVSLLLSVMLCTLFAVLAYFAELGFYALSEGLAGNL